FWCLCMSCVSIHVVTYLCYDECWKANDTFLFVSMSKGIMNGIVFSDPVPAMTIASNLRIIASETSICQSYGSLPKHSQNNLAKSFQVLLLSYCVFFLADLHEFSTSACAA